MSKKKNPALDTTKKGGRAPPEVSLDDVVKNLFEYFKGFKGLREAENEIKEKYNIDKNTTVWNEDDVKKAWGKTQRMSKYSRRRKTWSLAIILQAINDRPLNKTNCTCEKTADINVGHNAGTESQHFICEKTADICKMPFNQLEEGKKRKYSCDSDNTKDDTKRKCVVINEEQNAGTESQQSTCENTPNTNEEQNAGTEIQQSTCSADPETVYIRIPLSFMNVTGQELPFCEQAEKKGYKLIDGVPSLTQTMKKTSYVVQYDNRTRNPAWVFEILNKSTITDDEVKKCNVFSEDSMIHEHFRTYANAKSTEYSAGGYDRGHMAAAANHKWSQKAKADTFLLSNMAPQKWDLNRRSWKDLEKKCRDYTTDFRNVYMYTGPIYCPSYNGITTYQIIRDKAVPTHFFKVIILEKNDGTLDVECYIAANANNQPYLKTDLDDIERCSGLVFSEKSPSVSKDKRVTVQWKAEEGSKPPVEATFTITPSQDSMEQIF